MKFIGSIIVCMQHIWNSLFLYKDNIFGIYYIYTITNGIHAIKQVAKCHQCALNNHISFGFCSHQFWAAFLPPVNVFHSSWCTQWSSVTCLTDTCLAWYEHYSTAENNTKLYTHVCHQFKLLFQLKLVFQCPVLRWCQNRAMAFLLWYSLHILNMINFTQDKWV